MGVYVEPKSTRILKIKDLKTVNRDRKKSTNVNHLVFKTQTCM